MQGWLARKVRLGEEFPGLHMKPVGKWYGPVEMVQLEEMTER